MDIELFFETLIRIIEDKEDVEIEYKIERRKTDENAG